MGESFDLAHRIMNPKKWAIGLALEHMILPLSEIGIVLWMKRIENWWDFFLLGLELGDSPKDKIVALINEIFSFLDLFFQVTSCNSVHLKIIFLMKLLT